MPATAFAGLLAIAGTVTSHAQLPGLKEKNWIGNFLAYEGKAYQFVFTTQGKGELSVLGKKGTPLGRRIAMQVEFVVVEQLSDGRVFQRYLELDSLESPQEPTMKIQDIVIKGKVRGGAAFEAYITEERGAITFGGKLLDAGTLSNNPLKFGVHVAVPDVYPYDTEDVPDKAAPKDKDSKDDKAEEEKDAPRDRKAERAERNKQKDDEADKEDRGEDPDDAKDSKEDRKDKKDDKGTKPVFDNRNIAPLETRIKDDRIQLMWTDGKRSKPATTTTLTPEELKEINGSGISAVELLFNPYQGKRYILGAGANSSMRIGNSTNKPLYRGFDLVWTNDTAKDPENKARLKIEVK